MFTKTFFLSAIEAGITAAAAAFTGSLVFTSGVPSWRGLVTAGIAAGMAFVYTFVKTYGAVQALKAEAKKSRI